MKSIKERYLCLAPPKKKIECVECYTFHGCTKNHFTYKTHKRLFYLFERTHVSWRCLRLLDEKKKVNWCTEGCKNALTNKISFFSPDPLNQKPVAHFGCLSCDIYMFKRLEMAIVVVNLCHSFEIHPSSLNI